MATKNFSISLNNGKSSLAVALVLPTVATPVSVPIPRPSPVPVPRPSPPPAPRPTGQVEFKQAGTQQFIVPPGVTSITYTVLGAGGGGGSSYEELKQAGGGGGEAGEYEVRTITVTPGQALVINVGAGGSAGQPGGATIIRDARTGQVVADATGGAAGVNASKNKAGDGGATLVPSTTTIDLGRFGKVTVPTVKNVSGTNGSAGAISTNNDKLNGLAVGGNGAPSPLGSGGSGGKITTQIGKGGEVSGKNLTNITPALTGGNAPAPGAGGGGGGSVKAPNGTKISGGSGGTGYVKISF